MRLADLEAGFREGYGGQQRSGEASKIFRR